MIQIKYFFFYYRQFKTEFSENMLILNMISANHIHLTTMN